MTETRTTPGVSPAEDAPIVLRRLRTESQYREQSRGLERRERDKYGSLLWNLMRMEAAPKVKIMDLVGPSLDGEIDPQNEGSLKSVVDFYSRRPDRAELMLALKFFTVYLMQRARREKSFARQQFLLFKAIDMLRSIVHYSTWSVNRDAEGLVYGILEDLNKQKPGKFAQYMDSQHRIYLMMRKLQEVPQEFSLRLKLGEEYSRQTSFFDALVQYEFLNRFYPRFFKDRNLDMRLSAVYTRVVELFRNMVDHMETGYRDARKVRAFIERYNREYSTRKLFLVPLNDLSRGSLAKTAKSMREIGAMWMRRTLQLKMVKPEELAMCALDLARNLLREGHPREAHTLLSENYRSLSGISNTIEGLRHKVAYLDVMVDAAVRARRRDRAATASTELRETRAKLEEMVQSQSEYQKRRDAIKREAASDDDDEQEDELV